MARLDREEAGTLRMGIEEVVHPVGRGGRQQKHKGGSDTGREQAAGDLRPGER
jgi:hypothetical protein